MIQGIEHTAIASPNPQKLAEWYVQHLDFTINYQSGNAVFVKAQNGFMLEIIPAEGARGPQTMKDPGIRHLAIAVSDFDAVYGLHIVLALLTAALCAMVNTRPAVRAAWR